MVEMSSPSTSGLQVEILHRVCSLPTVATALHLGSAQYNKLKSRNGIVGGAIQCAEKSATFAVSKAVPYLPLGLFARPIEFCDNIACRGFDRIKERIPQIGQPPEQIYADVRNFSYEKLQDVAAAMRYNAANAYLEQLYAGVEAALKTTDGILDHYIALIGEKNIAVNHQDNPDFRQHLDEISQKIGICFSHHAGRSIASVKEWAVSPRDHLVATLKYLRDIKTELQNGGNIEDVLRKLQVTWIGSLLTGNKVNESAARQVLTLLHGAVVRATGIPPQAIAEKIVQYFPTRTNERISLVKARVVEQFRQYILRLQAYVSQLPSSLEWMPRGISDLQRLATKPHANNSHSDGNNHVGSENSTSC